MALLQGNSKRSEAILGCQGLAGTRGEKEPNHLVVVLLGGHVERGEPVLRLHVDTGAVVHPDLDNVLLTSQGGDVQRSVALKKCFI